MIVITSLTRTERHVVPGDTFNLAIRDGLNCEVLISETITVAKTIDFFASYRFTQEDGMCLGFHLCGIFGNSKELPIEIKEAKMLEDLTKEQYRNLEESVGIKLPKRWRGPLGGGIR